MRLTRSTPYRLPKRRSKAKFGSKQFPGAMIQRSALWMKRKVLAVLGVDAALSAN